VVPEFCYVYLFSLFSTVHVDIPELQLKTRGPRFVSDVFKYGFEESVWALGEGDDKDGDCSLYMSVYYGDANKQYKVGGSKCCLIDITLTKDFCIVLLTRVRNSVSFPPTYKVYHSLPNPAFL
jgi:hypothetical protein